MNLLQVTNLSKAFGGVQAVQNVSLALQAGELLALIGPNGAGKSTTFNMVGGQLAPDSGQVLLNGQDITGLPPRAVWRRGVGRTFQVAQTFATLTVAENVQMALLSADRPCSELAYGDVKRVELAMALAHNPQLLLMDEPTAGMAPGERVALMQLTRQIARQRRMGVLFTEHSMDVVFGQADRVAVLVRGQLLAEGTPQAIRADARVQQAYLGTGLVLEKQK